MSLLLSAGIVGGVATATTAIEEDTTSSTSSDVYGVAVDPDTVLLRTELRPNGTALWRVEYRIRLDDENTTEAFERHRDSIESNPERYRDRFETDMRATVAAAENATGRSMNLTDVTVSVERDRLPQEYGIIIYTFDWHGFAATNDTTIRAGDALAGMFLDNETTFITAWPNRYNRVTVTPTASGVRENAVVWDGPMYFGSDQPRVVVSTATDPKPTTETAGSAAQTDPGVMEDPASTIGVWVIGALLAGLIGVGAATYLEVVPVPFSGSAEEEGPALDQALLSNEEQVRTVLEHHDGRLKQQTLAEELDWTDAKTSKVIREMREDDEIETFRIGRENVVTLPDTDLDKHDT